MIDAVNRVTPVYTHEVPRPAPIGREVIADNKPATVVAAQLIQADTSGATYQASVNVKTPYETETRSVLIHLVV